MFVFGDRNATEVTLGVPNTIGFELEVGGIGSKHSSVGVHIDVLGWGSLDMLNVYMLLSDSVDAPSALEELPGVSVHWKVVGGASAVLVVGHVVDEFVELV